MRVLFTTLMLISSPTIAIATCYESSILSPAPFLGNNNEVFKLTDGSIWQVKYEYEYLYEYYPQVLICSDESVLIVGNKKLNVQLISNIREQGSISGTDRYIESQINGDFEGWEGETIYELTNGQIWQQSSYTYRYSYSFMPKVTIYENGGTYFMQVKGDSGSPIAVVRLK